MKQNLFLSLLIFSFLFMSSQVFAAKVHGVFRVVKGQVKVKSGKTGKIKRAKIGAKIYPKDTIITSKDSRAKIIMSDKNIINVSPESEVEFKNYEFEPKKNKKNVLLNVLYGKVRSKVNQKYDGKKSKFQVKTPTAVAGVRGTDFLASFSQSQNTTQIFTFEGRVSFGLPGANGTILNPVNIGVGQTAQNVLGQIPSPPKVVPPNRMALIESSSNADTAKPEHREPSSEQPRRQRPDKKNKNPHPEKKSPEMNPSKEPEAKEARNELREGPQEAPNDQGSNPKARSSQRPRPGMRADTRNANLPKAPGGTPIQGPGVGPGGEAPTPMPFMGADGSAPLDRGPASAMPPPMPDGNMPPPPGMVGGFMPPPGMGDMMMNDDLLPPPPDTGFFIPPPMVPNMDYRPPADYQMPICDFCTETIISNSTRVIINVQKDQ